MYNDWVLDRSSGMNVSRNDTRENARIVVRGGRMVFPWVYVNKSLVLGR
jgi:hypothetical protein